MVALEHWSQTHSQVSPLTSIGRWCWICRWCYCSVGVDPKTLRLDLCQWILTEVLNDLSWECYYHIVKVESELHSRNTINFFSSWATIIKFEPEDKDWSETSDWQGASKCEYFFSIPWIPFASILRLLRQIFVHLIDTDTPISGLYTVLPLYSKIQVLLGITSCRLIKWNKINLNSPTQSMVKTQKLKKLRSTCLLVGAYATGLGNSVHGWA